MIWFSCSQKTSKLFGFDDYSRNMLCTLNLISTFLLTPAVSYTYTIWWDKLWI